VENFAPIFIDTETCGLHGLVVLIQWAEGDGPINLFSPWTSPAKESWELIMKFVHHKDGLIFFNAVFDWFHLVKWYTIIKQLMEIDPDVYPEDYIETIIELEEAGRDCPTTIRPQKVCDLFLHARRTSYQSTMERKDVVLRRVPTPLAWMVAEELEKRIPLKDIYFARRKDKNQPKWNVRDRKDTFGEVDPDWKDIVLKFKPSSALKALAVDVGLATYEQILRYGDISPRLFPVEFGYAPFAKAAIRLKLKNKSKERKRAGPYRNTWPALIKQHIIHWGYNELARKYAEDDIVYTRGLCKFFKITEADMGDMDSELAIMVACSRWRGYRMDIAGAIKHRDESFKRKLIFDPIQNELVPLPTAPADVKRYIMAACDENEKLAFNSEHGNTKKVTLEYIAREWKLPCMEKDPITKALIIDHDKCSACKGTGFIKHPAAVRCEQIVLARKADKERELWDKIIAAGRLHASLKVIGTLSGRMSGADGLNIQAVKNTFAVKMQFLFTWGDEVLAGGDFDAFEVTIAVAVYNDPELKKDLLTCELCKSEMIFDQNKCDYICSKCGSNKGQKIHALFGMFCFPGMTYDEIKATEKTDDDKYTKSKQAVFLKIYGGDAGTMQDRLGIPLEAAEEANRRFDRKYKGVGRAQQVVVDMFQSMRQPGGRGTKVEWHQPSDYMETLFGFKRYFTLENAICKALFELANKMPKAMKDIKLKVTRTDRVQTAGGAACSAIYSAAFNVQGHNKRAAANHVIQGTGAEATKRVQLAVWNLQPKGEHEWIVQPVNIHDSIITPVKPQYVEKVAKVVKDAVEAIRPMVPLIKMPWDSYVINWGDKGYGIVSINDQNQIVDAYKNRFDVQKFGLDFNEIYKCLTKQQDKYDGYSWRLMSKDEHVDYAIKKSWRVR
jgi:hypothetical protein